MLNWYKACVADVALYPENYADYYNGSPVGNANDRLEDGSIRPKPFWQKTWFMVLMCIILPPAGIYLFFKFHDTTFFYRVIVTALLVFYTLFIWMGFIGLNNGINLSGVKELFSDLKTATQQQTDEPETAAESEPGSEAESDDGEFVGE